MDQAVQKALRKGNKEHLKNGYRVSIFLLVTLLFISLSCISVHSSTPEWDSEGLGNHRVLLRVSNPSKVAVASIPWRRIDPMPELKGIIIISEKAQKNVSNIYASKITSESGTIYFEAPVAGNYYLYYMPYETVKRDWNSFPRYIQTEAPSQEWLNSLKQLQKFEIEQAEVLEFQGCSTQHLFPPLSIPATQNEVVKFLTARSSTNSHLLFYPESAETPIQLRHQIPLCWLQKQPQSSYLVAGYPGEYLAFQLGVVAANKDVANLSVGFGNFKGIEAGIDRTNVTCFNLQGVDYAGNDFTKNIFLEKYTQIPLWFGIKIPENTPIGNYKGMLYFSGWNLRHTPFPLTIQVKPKQELSDKELNAESNLNWLNSTIGLDSETLYADFPPIEREGNKIRVNHQQMDITPLGLPSFMDFRIMQNGVWGKWTPLSCEYVNNPEKKEISWLAQNHDKSILLECNATPQRDGLCKFVLQIHAYDDTKLDDVSLIINELEKTSPYFMGLGKKGGKTPESFRWNWNTKNANSYFWLGNMEHGLWLHFLGLTAPKDPYFMESPYKHWAGDNNLGYIDFTKDSEKIEIATHSGEIFLKKGDTAIFQFNLMQTPVRPSDKNALKFGDKKALFQNWSDNVSEQTDPLNYRQSIASFAEKMRNDGKYFYLALSAREIPYQINNFWTFQMLDNEIFQSSSGFLGELQNYGTNYWSSPIPFIGDSWLCEHIGTGYRAYWRSVLQDGCESTTIGIESVGRYQNYFLETANSVLENVSVDGLRIAAPMNRITVMRLKNILKSKYPNAKLIMTTGDNFTPENGMNNTLCQYMDLLPWIDAIYLATPADNLDKDFLRIERSGEPFGISVLTEKDIK